MPSWCQRRFLPCEKAREAVKVCWLKNQRVFFLPELCVTPTLAAAMSDPRTLPSPNQIRLNPAKILAALAAFIILMGIFSCFYSVPANSVAVVQRFGGFHITEQPGLRFKLPWGIDSVTLVEVMRQQKLEFGYGTRGATNDYQYSPDPRDQEAEKNMVTGDLNSALVEWVVQYTIQDPRAYLFEVRDPLQTMRDLAEAAMREVVGDRSIDEVLTVGRQDIEVRAAERLRQLTASLNVGIRIDTIQLGNVNPPRMVEASFNDVNRAQQEKESTINQAKADYFKAVPKARGEAKQKISAAEGYASKRINEAEGDANRFNALLAEFSKAPEVTKKRIYLETLSEVLPGLTNKVILDDKAPQFLPFLNLQTSQNAR
jgi:modulator of FtsH protease HflK